MIVKIKKHWWITSPQQFVSAFGYGEWEQLENKTLHNIIEKCLEKKDGKYHFNYISQFHAFDIWQIE